MDIVESPRLNQNDYLSYQVLNLAVSRIQRAWRRYIDIQVFKYYRNLVAFHNEGDPALIMRYINPIEAQLIDPASGIHIRFRLAGDQFPPTIYYKIYTHRPVQDIGANAPRDYTRPCEKMTPAMLRNNRSLSSSSSDKRMTVNNNENHHHQFDGWYRRVENNGWRPVSDKHLLQMNIDYYYGSGKNKHSQMFHHLKVKRRQDIELNKKKKKIEWMKKMYLGKNKASVKNEENSSETTKLSALDGAKTADEADLDELLEWSNALDFDAYYNQWQRIGTTKRSDKLFIDF